MLARGVGVRYNHSCYANGNCGGFLCPDTFIRLAQRAGKHSGVIPALRWRSNQTVMLTGPLAFDKENLK
jgi:hypothetical protein